MILTKMDEILRKEGLEEIEAVGRLFDPLVHEAVGHVEKKGCEDNTIVSEIRKGYKLNGKVIRPSIVEVAYKPKVEKHEPEPNKEEGI